MLWSQNTWVHFPPLLNGTILPELPGCCENEVRSVCLAYSRWWDAPPSLDMHDSESTFTH